MPTLVGREDLTIPRGTQSGDVFRIHGKGLRDPRGRGVGDLLIQAVIEVPKKVSKRQEELLRQLAEVEHAEVTPKRKSFLGALAEYFLGDDQQQTEAREKEQEHE